MKTSPLFCKASRSGYSLITTLVLTGAATALLAGTLARTFTGSKLNDRNNLYLAGTAAAEAATEKVLARAMNDFENGGELMLSNNLSYYQTSLTPNAAESSYWNNFQFSDGQGNVGQTYIARTTTNANAPYVQLLQQYPGLNAFASTYRIVSNAKPLNSSYTFTNAVQQDLQMAEIPVFQFAIFYNGLLEFSDAATMTVNGRVHCNSNIYVGSSASLTFNYLVTASGVITNPPWSGYSWSGAINYNGTPTPGWGTGEPILSLPLGAASNSPIEMINMPASGEAQTNAISSQRYFNKASLVIMVSNSSVTVTIKGSPYDSLLYGGSPLVYTNNAATNTIGYTNWVKANFNYWLSTNTSFFDDREGRTNRVTQIDIGRFGTWISTNTNCLSKWSSASPFNGIIYVADWRTTNSHIMDCVRLTNGQTIPSIAASNTTSYSIPGLTVATPNPLYINGLYNCPTYQNSTNTGGSRPCSVICDALTILSPSWTDSSSFSSSVPSATSSTVNTAIIAGNVTSTALGDTGFSGGVHNLTRFLENWGNDTLWLNTSIINLYPSAQACQQFQMPPTYYTPPTRQFTFDKNFTTAAGLPPGTPLVYRVIRATWCNPPPNTVTYAPSPTLDFVPR